MLFRNQNYVKVTLKNCSLHISVSVFIVSRIDDVLTDIIDSHVSKGKYHFNIDLDPPTTHASI